MTRYYAEEPCEHGSFGPCDDAAALLLAVAEGSEPCPGGARWEFTIDYERADAAFRIALATKGIEVEDLPTFVVARAIVQAALGDFLPPEANE